MAEYCANLHLAKQINRLLTETGPHEGKEVPTYHRHAAEMLMYWVIYSSLC